MSDDSPADRPRRRLRYRGKNPRRFEEKYKEHDPSRYPDTIAKVVASGKTPAGSHRPIMVAEVLAVLAPQPGEIAVDAPSVTAATRRKFFRVSNRAAACLVSMPIRSSCRKPKHASAHSASVKTASLRTAPTSRACRNCSRRMEIAGADLILADLGVSSMQLDDPARGFSLKLEGPLDLRMNPQRGSPASLLLREISSGKARPPPGSRTATKSHPALAASARRAEVSRPRCALADAIRAALPARKEEERELSVRRVFQALRIAVNDEFSALETFLRNLPACLNPGGRAAILTFHSGEDRRVKKAFEAGLRDGHYADIAQRGHTARP